ncbi:MAG: methylated-DNA--[protein]-cysteine S-methyltransferase [Calditrichaeota bacterium]|nr:methylated-DNA--[protein]-cysteine S-methyltransferase [Calditrichota bacterium]
MENHYHYRLIEQTIHYLTANFKEQPSLDDLAKQVHLSPFHFQRIFTEWAGISPKKFLQFITIEHAKKMLHNESATLFDVAYESGLSGSGRLHDLFITIEAMTPGDYKNGGRDLDIRFQYIESPFGQMLIAATEKGICHLAFNDIDDSHISQLKNRFPNAHFSESDSIHFQAIRQAFSSGKTVDQSIQLHIKGSPFQIKVWESLLKIPSAGLSTYQAIARSIKNPRALRAVGTAIGQNPVAYLIPCHRVIRSSGIIGEYHWGADRKAAMIGWEAARQVG